MSSSKLHDTKAEAVASNPSTPSGIAVNVVSVVNLAAAPAAAPSVAMKHSSNQVDGLASYQRGASSSQDARPPASLRGPVGFAANNVEDSGDGVDEGFSLYYQEDRERRSGRGSPRAAPLRPNDNDLRDARLTYYVLLGVFVASALYAFLLSPAPPLPPFSATKTTTTAALADASPEALSVSSSSTSKSSEASVQDLPSSTSSSLLVLASKMWGRSRDAYKTKPKVGTASPSTMLSSAQAEAGLQLPGYPSAEDQLAYERELHQLDWDEVEADVRTVLTTSQHFWPADYGHYGGLFVRLAWHSCGSYRLSDGRGGCDGGAQRFDPERSWPDNTNLDKARRLLEPVKLKHGRGLSWGDLMALAGTVAIESMGGPTLGFCAGRLDVVDNAQTRPLGPTPEQEKFAPCETNGACPFPLGQNTLGLIYVNPEGPMGQPDPAGAADTVRDVFGRMDWSGRELVGLIGGGHTFGKAHGASKASAGEPPDKCPFASWAGPKGADAITSGFEGPWTSHPTSWDNDYFKYLLKFDWEPVQSPAGHWQWHVRDADSSPHAPSADPHNRNGTQRIMMLTTDVALLTDPEYQGYVEEFANNLTALEETFARAWYKLVTRDMGPVTRCAGPRVPPPQHFQNPLPPPLPHHKLADMDRVAYDIRRVIRSHPDQEFLRLAFQCASTYRATDHNGGCNGGRIRFSPGKDWPSNSGLDRSLELLGHIKDKYGDGLSYADLIVLAGNVAAEERGSPRLSFCPGRVDDTNGKAWKHLEFGNESPPSTVDELLERASRRGQTPQDVVALSFVLLGSSRKLREVLKGSDRRDDTNSTPSEIDILTKGIVFYPELRTWAEHYASSGDKAFGDAFRTSWTRLMNADRFDGPVRNACPLTSAA